MDAQSDAKFIVGNSYELPGCSGPVLSTASINTDQCYYARDECVKNKGLEPECEYLKSLSLGTDISLIGTCQNGSLVAAAYLGDACAGGLENATLLTNGFVLPTDSCILKVSYSNSFKV